ncbi:alpha/beta hydrolase [Aestuariicoccus sp. MJ-SS9]|uniref:alpha/beta fold hydrolase n=1 Tax=Aestuariicoccus sp. MJ-SS9 TaxID=3079855 RepID=UPI00290F70DE|nr:alpha/beta hydrolase [Aestuariicoccus sp. MJ-SS9]MDU8911771.1 alpha/beta hydrolase [Aestuariicoccus sp. MJ-SS9]
MPRDSRAGLTVHWQSLSEGRAPALLLHCALAYSGAYRALAEALTPDLGIVAPDMPGHGRSDDWDGQTDMHDLVTAVAASFLVPGTHLIGHSFGATVALRLAQEHPGQVASLTLIEPVLFAAARDEDPALHADHMRRSASYVEAMKAHDWETAAERFTANWGDGRNWEALQQRQSEGFIRRIPLVAATQDCLNEDTAGLLAPGRIEAVRAPTLLLRGARTMPVIAPVQAAIARRLPDAREEVIAGAGHMLPLSHPEAVAAAIRARLGALSPGAQSG